MRLLTFTLAASLALGTASTASAATFADKQIGIWKLNGADGACAAGANFNGQFVVFVSADGDNDGGLLVTAPGVTSRHADGTEVQVTLTLDGDARQRTAFATANPEGFFIPFSMTREMPRLGNNARIALTDGGRPLIEATLSDVNAMVSELAACDRIVG